MKFIKHLIFCCLLLAAKDVFSQSLVITSQSWTYSSIFRFTLTSADTTTLKIYTKWGLLVKSFLNDSLLPAGAYTYTWRNDTLQPDIYYAIFIHNGIGDTSSFARLWPGATDIGTVDANPLFALYPNPAKDKLYFNKELIGTSLAVYDAAGRQYSITVRQNEIDISALPSGIYSLCFNDKKLTKQFVKD